MASIEIQLLAGTQAGRAAKLDGQQFTFGRSATADIVVDDSHASREHGRLVCEDGQWRVENDSPNGTTVNGKRIRKPMVLANDSVIGVGKTPLFRVRFAATAPPLPDQATTGSNLSDQAPQQSAAEVQEAIERRKRVRLWTIIGIYFFVVLGGVLIVSQFVGEKEQSEGGMPRQITQDQIAAEITRPLRLTVDEREAKERLAEARSLYGRRDQSARTLYEAHRAFKEALALSGADEFEDGLVQLEFDTAEEQLIEQVTNAYRQAYAVAADGQYAEAEVAFRHFVRDVYPAKESALFANANDVLAYVRRRAGR